MRYLRPSLFEYFWAYLLSIAFFPLTFLFSFFIVNPNEERIILLFGKLRSVHKPGLSFKSIFGRTSITVSKRVQILRHHKASVIDSTGAMVEVSAVCVFQVVDSIKAALAVEDYRKYVENTSLAVLKRVASRFPYMSDKLTTPSLQSECTLVGQALVRELMEKVDHIGVYIRSFELVDLCYEHSIAKQMLAKQQAGALVSARELIVEGATKLAHEAVDGLEAYGVCFSENDRIRIVGNLLTILCSDAHSSKSTAAATANHHNSEVKREQDDAVISKLEAVQSSVVKIPENYAALIRRR
ncbi:hypothetical protein RCL1_006838 [Eukaryota sp. TZLM3-RCL]